MYRKPFVFSSPQAKNNIGGDPISNPSIPSNNPIRPLTTQYNHPSTQFDRPVPATEMMLAAGEKNIFEGGNTALNTPLTGSFGLMSRE